MLPLESVPIIHGKLTKQRRDRLANQILVWKG